MLYVGLIYGVLTGKFDEIEQAADVDSVMEEIKAAFEEEQKRLERISDAQEEQ